VKLAPQQPTVDAFEDVIGVPYWFLTDNNSPGLTGTGISQVSGKGLSKNWGQCGTFWGGKATITMNKPASSFFPSTSQYPTITQCPAFDWSSANGQALLADGTKQLKAAATTFCAPFEADLPPYSCQNDAPTPYSKAVPLGLSYTSSFYGLFALLGPILAGMLVAKGSLREDDEGSRRLTRGMSHVDTHDANYVEMK
jgi:hypothetical protein